MKGDCKEPKVDDTFKKLKKHLRASQKFPKTPEFPNQEKPLTGWKCPVCGRGNSPFTISCPCVTTNPYKYPPITPEPWIDPGLPYRMPYYTGPYWTSPVTCFGYKECGPRTTCG